MRITHWLNALLLLGMIASGLQIYGAFRTSDRAARHILPNPWDGTGFPEWARLGGWLAGGLNWHFALAWPFVLTGLVYLTFLAVLRRVALVALSGRGTSGPAWEMQLYYLGLRSEHPPQGKHNALQKLAYTVRSCCSARSPSLSGFAIYKPVQLAWLTALFGGYELARYWHFCSSGSSSASRWCTCCWCSWWIPRRCGR